MNHILTFFIKSILLVALITLFSLTDSNNPSIYNIACYMGVLIVVDGYALLRDWINKNRPNKQMKIKLPSRNMGKNHKLIQSLREENNKLKDLLAEILEDGGFRNFEVQERCRQILDSETK